MRVIRDPLKRFLAKIIKNDNECWIWQASKRDGYGRFHFKNKWTQATRWIYEYYKGKIPKNLELDHVVCQNRACVNPDHLEAVTHTINVERGKSPFIINKHKTHCKRGHKFTKANTLYSNNNQYRNCKICDNNRKREFYLRTYVKKGNFHANKTHCKNGHLFSKENTYINPSSKSRRCRICNDKHHLNWNIKRRQKKCLSL